MFVEKPKEEVYDVVINEVGSFEIIVDVLVSKCEIVVRAKKIWPTFCFRLFAASFGSCIHGCGLLVCMQNSAGKRMLLLSEKATEAIKHFSYGERDICGINGCCFSSSKSQTIAHLYTNQHNKWQCLNHA